jgi:hypothetical protein
VELGIAGDRDPEAALAANEPDQIARIRKRARRLGLAFGRIAAQRHHPVDADRAVHVEVGANLLRRRADARQMWRDREVGRLDDLGGRLEAALTGAAAGPERHRNEARPQGRELANRGAEAGPTGFGLGREEFEGKPAIAH